jgi:hypothetical protein
MSKMHELRSRATAAPEAPTTSVSPKGSTTADNRGPLHRPGPGKQEVHHLPKTVATRVLGGKG